MQHIELMSVLEDLLPEVAQTKQPEDVLLKAARARNFSPAQLTKLGHLYNTAKVHTVFDHGGERGRTFGLLDVPNMISRFTQGSAPAEKQASAAPAPAIAYRDVFPSRAAMTQDLSRFDSFLIFEKAADAALDKLNYSHLQDNLQQHLFDASYDLEQDVEKLATAMRNGRVIDFAAAEHDANKMFGEDGATACGWVAKELERRNIKVARWDGKSQTTIGYDRTGFARALNEYATGLKVIKTAREAQYLLNKQAAAAAQRNPASAAGAFDGMRPLPPEWEEFFASRHANPYQESGGGAGEPEPDPVFTIKAPSEGKGERPQAGGSTGGGDLADKVVQAIKDLGQHATAGAPLQSTLGAIDAMGPGKNKKQIQLDTAADDSVFAASLQRLLLTDTILSKHDPEMLANLANELRTMYPERIKNEGFLRYVLREAAQYGGALPAHLLKDLQESRKSQMQASKDKLVLDDAEYGRR